MKFSKKGKNHELIGFLNKRWGIIFFIVISFLLLSVFFALVEYFKIFGGGFSKSPGDWEAFGSYMAGTIGVVFAASNTFLFITLTAKIHSEEKNRWTNDSRIKSFETLIQKLQLINSKTCRQNETIEEVEVYLDSSLNYYFTLTKQNEYDILVAIQAKIVNDILNLKTC